MGDWADDLANDWVKDIKAGLLDEPALAMKIRNIEVQATNELTEYIKELNRRMMEALDHPKFNLLPAGEDR